VWKGRRRVGFWIVGVRRMRFVARNRNRVSMVFVYKEAVEIEIFGYRGIII
jgi:hypothetical protein